MSKGTDSASPALASISRLKNLFFELLTEFKSSHLTEAIAAGLGYGSNAARLADVRPEDVVVLPLSAFDTENMAGRLSTLSGMSLEGVSARVVEAFASMDAEETIEVGRRSSLVAVGDLAAIRDIVRQAIKEKVEYIHIREGGDDAGVRIAGSGILLNTANFDDLLDTSKVGVNTARFQLDVDGLPVGVRAIYDPAHTGTIVMRLQYPRPPVGHGEKAIEDMVDQIRKNTSGGIMVVSGPTMSGKSTSVHLARQQLLSEGYYVGEVTNLGVQGRAWPVLAGTNPGAGRIVVIDDLRDEESCEKAVEYARNGAIVLATVHGKDIRTTLERLGHIGMTTEAASLLLGVVSQRLARAANGGRGFVLLNERVFFESADEAKRAFEGNEEPEWASIVDDGRMKYIARVVDLEELQRVFGDDLDPNAKSDGVPTPAARP